MRNQRIRTHVDPLPSTPQPIRLGGWFCGKDSYLWIGEPEPDKDGKAPAGSTGRCFALVSGQRLYRLAKAIVDHYEAEK